MDACGPHTLLFSPIDYSHLLLSLTSSMESRIHRGRWEVMGKGKGQMGYDDAEEEEEEVVGAEDDKKKKAIGRRGSNGGGAGGAAPVCCQAERCATDLTEAKRYYRRHKVCEPHSKAPVVIVGGVGQRFCQQCSRFHELAEFDDTKRSCRRRLAGHNERRRKNSSEFHAEGSSNKGEEDRPKENHYRQTNQGGRTPATLSENSKHYY